MSFSCATCAETNTATTQAYKIESNILYRSQSLAQQDKYITERCRLDIYYPTNTKDFATVVWFHGGGLTGGNKFIPDQLKNQGLAVAAANYRLYPKIKCPV